MRTLRLAASILAAFACAWIQTPAGSAPVSTFSIADARAQAGSAVVFTIQRLSGGGGIYVLFQTADGTAKAGPDYQSVKKLVYFKGGQISAQVSVPTTIDQADLGQTLQFSVAIAASRASASTAHGAIVEPPAPAPPPPPATQVCPDGSVILASAICPPAPPPPPTNSWIAAPLQDGGFARVKANDSLWDMTGPGAGRRLAAGEIVGVYFNGWGNEADGRTSFAIYAFADGSSGRAYAADLEGVAPVGTPPGLPADWWVPGLVTANKSCTDARADHAGQPGVTQGGVYRAAMLIGTHHKLAPAETGWAGAMWEVFATGDQNAPDPKTALTVVSGDCLTGQ